ncbi:MAG TPA: hypothetical protein VMD29_15440 [Terracidiphilus sp.]|nr:hypothetical protein [Terracidiphilus sp.]
MELSKIEQIEHAIGMLTPRERTRLYARIVQAYPDAFEEQLRQDVDAGKLDHLIDSALEDQKHGRIRSL